MLINFVSNIPRNLRSGGFSAMNFAAFFAVNKKHTVRYVGPIDPPPIMRQRVMSRALRLAGRPGDFFFFSQRRLETIAEAVREQCSPEADLDFFHGFTPWIATRPIRPYMTYSDCTFRDYIEVFHKSEAFRAVDVARIEQAEAAWLRHAEMIVFTSEWAAERARHVYGLERSQLAVAGIFGDFEPPARDTYKGGKQFAFISTNFLSKGGPVVLKAFRKVRERDPAASLMVVGDRGDLNLSEPGVAYAGFLRKEHPAEYARLREIFSSSRAIVNATKSDTAPVLLVEAGYFGCPAISTRRFAIPEIVNDRETGILIDDPLDSNAVADAMLWMLEAGEDYRQMRQAAWNKTRQAHAKSLFARRLLAYVDAVRKSLGVSAP